MRTLLASLALGCSVVGLASLAHAQSAWLPARGEFTLAPTFAHQEFDQGWVGATQVDLTSLGIRLVQRNYQVAAEYGLTPSLALDLTGGWSQVQGVGNKLQGWSDTYAGVRWSPLAPPDPLATTQATFALRLGGIIQGTYPTGSLLDVDDGANGFEGSVLYALAWPRMRLGVQGDLGYRVRYEHVPDDLFTSVGVSGEPAAWLTLGALYRYTGARSGGDLLTPGFQWSDAKEIEHTLGGSATLHDHAGRGATVFASRVVAGRNTGEDRQVGLSLSLPF